MPLLIYLHGAGGVGDQIEKIKGQAMRVWQGLQKFNKGPCIIVAPQYRKKQNWPTRRVDSRRSQLVSSGFESQFSGRVPGCNDDQ